MTRYLIRIFCTLLLIITVFTSLALADSKVIELDFNDTDVSIIIKYISCLTGKKLVLDDQVKGKFSVYSNTKLSIEETYNIFISMLKLKGFSVVQSDNVIKILPTVKTKNSSTRIPTSQQVAVNENYVAQVIKLENIKAHETLNFLKPMISKDGGISAVDAGNLILLVDSSLNIHIIQTVLNTIDAELPCKGSDVIYLKNASAESIAGTIRQWFSDSGMAGSVLENQRQNAVLLFGTATIKKTIHEIVAKLDVPPRVTPSKVNEPNQKNTTDTVVQVVTPATTPTKLLLLGTATGTPEETFALVRHTITQEERVFQLGDMVFDAGCLVEVKKDQAFVVLKEQTRLKLDMIRDDQPTTFNYERR